MIESFRTIEKELVNPDIPIGNKWPLLHAIHTTADFDMENILRVDDNAIERIYTALTEGKVRTIITDVTMAASGIRKGAIERLGIEVKCYLNDPATTQLSKEKGITRTQAGIRLAAKRTSGCLVCIRECSYGFDGTMHAHTSQKSRPLWYSCRAGWIRPCM